MPKVGGRRKKVRSHKQPDPQQQRLTPKTFIFKRGKCPESLKDLTQDLRKCFYPNTAMKLEDSNKLNVKSYLKAAKYYNVNHLIALQHSNDKEYARFIKVGGGEMLFRIVNFARMRDVMKNGGQQFSYSFKEALLVLNGFGESQQTKMIAKGLQELFPSLNLFKAKTENIKRVMSFTYRPKKKFVFFRQYKIVQSQAGVNSTFQKLLKKPQDLSSFKSIKEYLESQQSSVQGTQNQQKLSLQEMGPRMKMRFVSYNEKSGMLSEKDLEEAENEYNEEEAKRLSEAKNPKDKKKTKKEKGKKEEEEMEEQENEQDKQDKQEDEQGDQDGELEEDEYIDEDVQQIDLEEGDEDEQ